LELAKADKWRHLQRNSGIVWGECRSGGVAWFKAQFDSGALVFKCNCPSRKLPCRHILALMLLFVDSSESFRPTREMPGWVTAWIQARKERRRDESASSRAKSKENLLEEQRLKNREKRLRQMEAGLNELERWLSDVLRQGLAVLEGQSKDFWQEISTRLVDSKLSSLAQKPVSFPNCSDRKDGMKKCWRNLGACTYF